MAYQTSTATSMADLLTQLCTFAVANGWTQDQLDTGGGSFALHKGSVYVSGRWDTSAPLHISLHQALGYTGGNQPGAHPNDSGNGFNTSTSHANSNLILERVVSDVGNGPFTHYAFFENDASPAYIHVVVEIATGIFRHFGFGNINKIGTWTGGEYVYGQRKDIASSGSALVVLNTTLFDGVFNDTSSPRRASTLHCEGLPGQVGSGKWGQVWGNKDGALPADEAAVAKVDIHGGFRGGPIARHFAYYNAGASSGLMPWYTIALFYLDRANSNAYALGDLPDVRGMSLKFFAAKQELVVGSDTWIVYPDGERTLIATPNRTYYLGIAYKKVTA